MMAETVLVIGGTGLLGAPVARQLLGDGCRVRVLARTLPAAPDRDRHLEYVQGDLDDSDARVASEARLASITAGRCWRWTAPPSGSAACGLPPGRSPRRAAV
jgi:nucleoside-diphosphate-sugar epimerase